MTNRRDVLRTIGFGTGVLAVEQLFAQSADTDSLTAPHSSIDPVAQTSCQAATAIRNGDLSAESYAESLIAQSERWSHINSLISEDADALREAARAADRHRAAGGELPPLHGVPLVFKDNIDTVKLPTTAGTAALLNHRPGRHAPVAQLLFDAGALLFGKNNMHELAMGITSNNAVFGAARNPYDPSTIPGGSSGGTGASIAARIAPAGLGTDTGGSVRIPAALCGTYGLRPSTGRYPGEGIVPISSTLDTAGPLARDIADLALLDGIIAGDSAPLEKPDLSSLRFGIPGEHFWADIDAQTASIMNAFLDSLRSAGVTLVEKNISGFQEARNSMGRGNTQRETRRELSRYLEESGSGVNISTLINEIGSPDVKTFIDRIFAGPEVSLAEYSEYMEVDRPRYQAVYASYFSDNRLDAILFPATPLPARPIGHDAEVELNGRQVPTFRTVARKTGPAAGAGIPGLVVPAGLTAQGLPVGAELDGPVMTDRRLLAIGAAIQDLLPGLPPPGAAASESQSSAR
jgi:mandelamide amidase